MKPEITREALLDLILRGLRDEEGNRTDTVLMTMPQDLYNLLEPGDIVYLTLVEKVEVKVHGSEE